MFRWRCVAARWLQKKRRNRANAFDGSPSNGSRPRRRAACGKDRRLFEILGFWNAVSRILRCAPGSRLVMFKV